MKLIGKITLIAIVVAMLATGTAAYITYVQSEQSSRDDESSDQLLLAQYTLGEINRSLYNQMTNIEQLSLDPKLLEYMNSNRPEDMDTLLNTMLSYARDWQALTLIDPKGKIIASTSAKHAEIAEYPNAQASYEQTRQQQQTYSDLVLSDMTNLPCIFFGRQIRTSEDGTGAILLAEYDWQNINKVLENIAHPGRIDLIDQDYYVIASSDPMHQAEALNQIHKHDYFADIDANTDSLVIPSYHGNYQTLSTFIRSHGYRSFNGNSWSISITTPYSIFEDTAKGRTTDLLLVLVPICFSALAILVPFVYLITIKPIHGLLNKAQALQAGDTSILSASKARDEIGKLDQTIADLSSNLLRSKDELERIIQTLPVAIFIADKDGSIEEVNQAALQLLKCEPNDIIGKKMTPLLPNGQNTSLQLLDRLPADDSLDQANSTGQRINLSIKGNENVPVSLSVRLLKGAKGDIEKVIFIAKDIRELANYAKQRLAKITPILQKVALGDFSENITIPVDKDEFTEHLIALSLMIDDFKKMVDEIKNKSEELEEQNSKLAQLNSELKKTQFSLENKVKERTQALEQERQNLEKKIEERTEELRKLNAKLEEEVSKRTEELQTKISELERFNQITMGREVRILELKDELAHAKRMLRLKDEKKEIDTDTAPKAEQKPDSEPEHE